jgi:hypothetical protein
MSGDFLFFGTVYYYNMHAILFYRSLIIRSYWVTLPKGR